MAYKIAVCLYGQPRTWKYCAEHIKQQYANREAHVKRHVGFNKLSQVIHKNNEQVEFDFFASVKNYNFFNHVDGHRQYNQIPDVEVQDLLQTFKPKLSHVSEYEHEKYLTNGSAWGYAAMFHSIYRAVLLKQRYEAQHSFAYDAVILQRYDVVFNPVDQIIDHLNHVGVMPMTIYAQTGNRRFWHETWRSGPNDMIMIGDSISIDLITAYTSTVWLDPNNLDRWFPYGPNVFIGLAAHECNVQISNLNLRFAIVRPTADMAQSLPESFDYHAHYWLKEHPSNK